jgi:hypothetical protein
MLSIILLPTMTFVGLIVDSARVDLSRALVESAGELTTNAALANYDTVLKDVYGLFAMSQSADDPDAALQENLERYFKNTLQAHDLLESGDGELQSELLGQLQDIFAKSGAQSRDSLLDVGYEAFNAKYVDGSSLANPKILKSQIVEFMKYRGPASIGLSILDSLSIFKKTNAQGEVTNQKLKVDEALGDLGEASGKFYDAIATYDERVEAYRQAEAAFESRMGEIRSKLQAANETIIRYLLMSVDTGDLTHVKKRTVPVTNDEGEEIGTRDVYSLQASGESVSVTGRTDAEYRAQLTDIVGGRDAAERSLYATLSGEIGNLNAYVSAGDIPKINRIFSAYKSYAEYLKKVVKLQGKLENPESAESSVQSVLQDMYAISEAVKAQVNNYKHMIDQKRAEVNEAVVYATHEIVTFDAAQKAIAEEKVRESKFLKLLGGADAISYAIEQGEKVIEELKKVVKENNQLDVGNKAYASESSGNGGKDDFYATMNSTYEKNKAMFKEDDIVEIIRQLQAGRDYLGQVRELVDGYSFYGKSMEEKACDTVDKAIDAVKAKEDVMALARRYGEGTLSSAAVTTECGGFFDQYVVAKVRLPAKSGTVYLKKISESVDGHVVPSFYIYLVSNYGYKKDEDTSADKKMGDNIKSSASDLNKQGKEEAALKTDGVQYSVDIFANSPSVSGGESPGDFEDVDKDDKKGASQQFSNMQGAASDILGVLGGVLEDARDNILVSEYVFQNFSYYTCEKEEDFDPANYKTLTNVKISGENNAIYRTEIEYILFGNQGNKEKKFLWFTTKSATGPESNVAVAKQYIFAIRFLFNSIYALTDKKIDAQTLPPAMTIQAATCGVFPYQLAQVVMKLALSLAESTIDLSDLMDGQKVPLLKSADTWHCSLDGLINKLREEAVDNIKETIERKGTEYIGQLQEAIDDAGEWTVGKVNNLKRTIDSEFTAAVSNTLNTAAASMAQIATDKIQMKFVELFTTTGENVLTKESLEAEVDVALDQYIEDFSDEEHIVETLMALKLEVKDKITEKLYPHLDAAAKNISDATNGLELDATMFKELQDKVGEAVTGYIATVTNTISDKVGTFIGDATGKLKDLVQTKGEKILDDVGEKLSQKTSELLDSYFPTKTTKIEGTKNAGGETSSSTDTIFKFSYKDYLRLFLFLKLACGGSDGTMLRIADVIQLNLGSGMKEYAVHYGRAGSPAHAKGGQFRMNKAYSYVELNVASRAGWPGMSWAERPEGMAAKMAEWRRGGMNA